MGTYNTNMDMAPKDGETMCLLIPTGDIDHPVNVEYGWWDDTEGRFVGEWRYIVHEETEEPTPYSNTDPIGFMIVPEADPEIIETERAKLQNKAA